MPANALTVQDKTVGQFISSQLKRDVGVKVDQSRLTELVRMLGRALTAIEKKEAELSGATGPAVGVVEVAGRNADGFVRRYQKGSIYYHPPSAPCWVHGAILEKYLALGGESGFLGFPTTDEKSTPGGKGRFNHFEHGSIYWSYATGAHEIHGAIRDRWATIGWEQSYLGFPVSDEFEYTEGGRASTFEHGGIYWWDDLGARDIRTISFRYKGLYCFGETDEASAADEPYVLLGVMSGPGASGFQDYRSQIYDDVDAGDARPDVIQLYEGPPMPLNLLVTLQEHDTGDPDTYKAKIAKGVEKLSSAVGAACGSTFGPEAAPFCEEGWKELSGPIADVLNDLLGTGDDVIGKSSWMISAKDIVRHASSPSRNFWGIDYHFESSLLSDGEASYKVYFEAVVI